MQPNSNWVKNDQDYAVVFMHKTLDYTGTQMLWAARSMNVSIEFSGMQSCCRQLFLMLPLRLYASDTDTDTDTEFYYTLAAISRIAE